MVAEGTPPLIGMPDIQDKFEELLLQIASGFSHADSQFGAVFTRFDGLEARMGTLE